MTETVPPALPATSALSDWELWACAQQQLMQHGDDAPAVAAMRADALLEEGDIAGNRVWRQILSRIRQLQAPQLGETQQ